MTSNNVEHLVNKDSYLGETEGNSHGNFLLPSLLLTLLAQPSGAKAVARRLGSMTVLEA